MAKDKTTEEVEKEIAEVEEKIKEEKADTPEIEPKEVEVPVVVVKEIPTVETRNGVDQNGNPVRILTMEEAVTEIYKDFKAMRKAIG